jgi:hypothetical protein
MSEPTQKRIKEACDAYTPAKKKYLGMYDEYVAVKRKVKDALADYTATQKALVAAVADGYPLCYRLFQQKAMTVVRQDGQTDVTTVTLERRVNASLSMDVEGTTGLGQIFFAHVEAVDAMNKAQKADPAAVYGILCLRTESLGDGVLANNVETTIRKQPQT